MALRQELARAQISTQMMISELMDVCAEAIEHIAPDYLGGEILRSLIRKGQTIEMLSEELAIPPYEIEKRLYQLKEEGIIKKERERWYIN